MNSKDLHCFSGEKGSGEAKRSRQLICNELVMNLACVLSCTPSTPGFSILDGSLADFISDRRHHTSSWEVSRILIGYNDNVTVSGSGFSGGPSFVFGDRMHGLVQPTHRIFQYCVDGGALYKVSAHISTKNNTGAVFCTPVQVGSPFNEIVGPRRVGVAATEKGH